MAIQIMFIDALLSICLVICNVEVDFQNKGTKPTWAGLISKTPWLGPGKDHGLSSN